MTPADNVSSDPELAVGQDGRASALWWRLVSENNAWLFGAAILIGAVTALANVAFHWAIDGAHDLFWNQLGSGLGIGGRDVGDSVLDGLGSLPQRWWLVPIVPMAGMFLLVILDRWFPGEVQGYGLPNFLEKVNIKGGYIRRRWITLKTLSSAITLGSGMSAGIEGPIAQIGGSIGSTVSRAIRPSAERLRVLIACGSAAAIAATFSSPIAGVFFAQEIVLLGQFQSQAFALIVLASGASTVVSQYMRADHQVLHAPSFDYPINHELIFYVLLGLMSGLLAVFYIKSFYGIRDWFQRSRLSRSVTPILGGLIVGVSLIFFPQVSASGYATMNEVFAGGLSVGLLLSLVLVKIAMTGVTLGCGGSGGVFAPAMFIGAVFGGGFASLVNMLIPGALGASGSFGLIGMGAFLAASTHAPMTAIFLLWEMTRDYNVVLPIMITAITATLVARRLMTDSIDSFDLSRRGLDIHAGAEANLLRGLYVRGLVSRDFQQIPESMAVTDFVRYVTNSHHVYFPVVNRDNELTGIISMQELKTVLLHRDAWPFLIVGELAETDVLTVSGSDNLYDAMQLITARGLEQVPVVDESDPKRVIGMLKRADLQNFYQKRLLARELHG